MTVEQAIKKYKLQPVSVSVAKVKAKELNVEEVLYMNVQKNKYAYIVKDGARGIMLYSEVNILCFYCTTKRCFCKEKSERPAKKRLSRERDLRGWTKKFQFGLDRRPEIW